LGAGWHSDAVAHTHSHTVPATSEARPGVAVALAACVLALAALAIGGIVSLWPHHVPHGPSPYGGKGVTLVDATVTAVKPFDCGSTGMGPDNVPNVEASCAHVKADLKHGTAKFTLDPTRYVGGTMNAGDKIRLIQIKPPGQTASWEFLDFKRGVPLLTLSILFAVLVILIGRLRGFFALVGIGVTLAALVTFVLPALLAGQPAIPVAVVGSTAIMIAVLYLAHGISIRTTAALFGTLFGIALTAAGGWAATNWAALTGVGSEDDHLLVATAPHVSLPGVVAASMVIAGLGVLNDVTITQASAVWELRHSSPLASRARIFRSAMRIGRDHIASSVYTLVFAYAGSAMTVMLLITAYQPGLLNVTTSEQIAQEVVRTLIGAIGLVLAVPITTAIAIRLAPGPTRG
jgi:uncharacterized membrane protein